PVPFGAVGTPVVVGLSNLPDADIALFKEVGIHITALDLFAGTFIPFTIVVILTKFFGKNKSFKEALPLLPWTLLIGAVYTLRSEEHTSELQSRFDLVCRLL